MKALRNAVGALYDLAAGLDFNRADLLAGASALDELLGDTAIASAATTLRELAVLHPSSIGPREQKNAALVAAFIQSVAEERSNEQTLPPERYRP
jgi:hypothetical protein